jgi:hypothetical protein
MAGKRMRLLAEAGRRHNRCVGTEGRRGRREKHSLCAEIANNNNGSTPIAI